MQCNYLLLKELHMEYCMHHFLLEGKQILSNPPSNYPTQMVQTFCQWAKSQLIHPSTHITQPSTLVILHKVLECYHRCLCHPINNVFFLAQNVLSSKQFKTRMYLLLFFQKRLNGVLVTSKTTEH